MKQYDPQNHTDAEYILSVCPSNLRTEWDALIYEVIGEEDIWVNRFMLERYGELHISCRFLNGAPFYTKEKIKQPI